MSSDLPSRPSLEHLKKQAKERLRELQQRDPHAKLADAQHEIARAYGFRNWTELKDRVTAIESSVPSPGPIEPPTNPVFARFTDRAKRAAFFSRFEAGQLGHRSIDPEHLLLGVLRARLGLTSRILAEAGLSPDRIRSDVQARRETLEPLSTFVIIAFSPETKRAIQIAVAEADQLRHDGIGTAHLLLGLMQESTLAADILRTRGLTLDAVRRAVDELLNENG